MDHLLVHAHYIPGNQVRRTKIPKADELRHQEWITLSDGFQLELLIEMEVDVKIGYLFPHVFEPGIVCCKEGMWFVLVPHSVAIQTDLDDERFVSNHQCIRVGGIKSPIALEVREFRGKSNQQKGWHAKPLILLRYYSPGELDVAVHVQVRETLEVYSLELFQ